MKPIKKHILFGSILLSVTYMTLSDGYTALHSLRELPSVIMEEIGSYDTPELTPLVKQRNEYEDRSRSDIQLFPVLDDKNALGSAYIVQKPSRISHEIATTIVSSQLLEDTLIRNKHHTYLNPEEIGIEPASEENIRRAKKKFFYKESEENSDKIRVFEFGIAGQHLIFSKPVQISVEVPNIEEGSEVSISVLHEGEPDFGIHGLTDETGGCLPDGSSTRQISATQVRGGNAVFYTCGASTFAVGVPQVIHLPNSTVWSLLEQPDGKTILGGAFTTVGGYPRGRLARMLSGGTLDFTFTNPNINNIVYATALQSDGKIIAGGTFTSVNGTPRNYLARINTDGTLDTTFTPNLNNAVRAIAVLPDDSILIGGTFTTSSGTTRNRMLKFSATGGLIGSFTPSFNSNVFVITPEPSGTILVGGQFTSLSGTTRNRIARISATGGLIGSFTPAPNNIVLDIELFSDNSILISGQFTTFSGTARTRLAKVSSTGGLISSFSIGANGTVNTVKILSDDSVLVGGAFTTLSGTARSRVGQITATGGLTSFNPNSNNAVYAFLDRTPSSYVIGGAFTNINASSNTYLSYANNDGTLDSTYNLGINGSVWRVVAQPDGNIILGGAFTTVGGLPRGRLARVLSGGALDTSFANPNINNIVYATALQSDGKIIVGGAFTGVNGTTRNYLARINTNGMLDTTFTPNLNNAVRAIAVLPDDSILVGGTFTTSSGTTRNRMLKFTSTGGLIGSFTPSFNNGVFVITPEPSGNILVGGQFTSMSGTARNRVVRLSATGGITSFNPNMNNIVQDIKLYSDASMLIAGQFTSVSGIARTRLAKISATGGLISSFSIGANGTVNTIKVLADDSTILGGAFATMSGVARSRIAQISSTGVLDPDFNPNSNNTVYSVASDAYNNVLAGGAFTTMSGIAARYFVWIGLYDGDITGPQILSGSMISGSLLPIGNFSIRTNFTDTGGGIDTNSIYATLKKWDGAVWEPDTHALYLSGTPLITSATGIYTFSGVPYGKYLYSLHVPDVWGNETVYETTFYIDDIEWELGTDIIDIGGILPGIQKNSSGSTSSGEMVIIVRTVGAGFNIIMSGSSFSSGTSVAVPHWNGSNGYGYERYNGGYTGTLSVFSGATTLIAQGANINTNGNRNTYIYSIQYGTLVDMMQLAGDYRGTASFTLNLNY